MALDDEVGTGRPHDAGLFESLVRDIQARTGRPDQEIVRSKLELAVRDNLTYSLPSWKAGGVSEFRVSLTLPACPSITNESAEEYARVVYGAAKRVLEKEGFVLEELHWYYRPPEVNLK